MSDKRLCRKSCLRLLIALLGIAVLAAACSSGDSGTDAGDTGRAAGDSGAEAGDSGSAGDSGAEAGDSGSAGDSGTEVGDSSSAAGDSGTEVGDSSSVAGDSGTVAGDSGSSATGDGEPEIVETGPIKIGFHNMEGGALSFTQTRAAADAAVAAINAEGGVNGRPLELVRCGTDPSPESSIDCANKFVEEDVVASVQGIDVGADAMLPILAEAGIQEVGYLPFNEQQRYAENASFFGSPTPANAIVLLSFLLDLGVDKVAMIGLETTNNREFYANVLGPTAEDLGIDVEFIFYPAVGVDWTLVVSTGLASGVEAVATIGAPDQDCVGMLSALNALGFDGPVFMGVCSVFIDILVDDSVGVYSYSDFWWPSARDLADASTQQDIDRYVAAMEAADESMWVGDGLAIRTFASLQNLATVLRTIEGRIDAEAVAYALRTSGTHDGFMGQPFNCDRSAWPGQSACSVGMVIWRVTDDLSREMVSDGYVDLSEHRPSG